ncbi:MAG: hypothetical protein KJZ58_06355 [Flavobacteriales bacterium]|nr:hypothetical protein [Flavobacteriales bacterium]MCL4281867.1 hypothetical protein [Flavobacteriales bacterium]
MTDFFFAIGHFMQWVLSLWPTAGWGIPVTFIALIMVGMTYWLSIQRSLTRKAKERNGFI